MTISNNDEINYLEFLNLVKNTGIKKNTRNGITYSHFAHLLKFDISDKFPLLTTKKMFFKGIVEELLWFLRGSVNSKELESKGVNIWKGNSSREFLDANGFFNYDEGYLGPIYGYQWRSFNGKIDQLKYLLEEIQLENSRRILINAWNPCQLHEQALPPCHILYNFFKNNDEISCMMYMRSSDLFLGLPFNIASTALLTHIIAKVSGFKVKDIAISICDCHIYHEHIEPLNIQLERIPYEFPSIHIKTLFFIDTSVLLPKKKFLVDDYCIYETKNAIINQYLFYEFIPNSIFFPS
jgi:thymidylate synthase